VEVVLEILHNTHFHKHSAILIWSCPWMFPMIQSTTHPTDEVVIRV
jgi:hypothetical protein